MKSDLPGDFSNKRSNVNLTSADVISCPSWNFTPWRSLNVHVRASLLISQDSASSGTGFMSASNRTSWLYVIGERRLRENAGTSCGSSPVASLFWAETNTPPDFGDWASAGRARLHAPAARLPVLSSSRRVKRWKARRPGSVVMVMSPVAGRSGIVRLLRIRIQDVAEAVAHQVERQHCDHDRDAGEHGDPRRRLEIGAALVQHVAPRRRGRLGGETEVGERRLDEDRLGQGHRALDDERRHH